jgi:hypothetical protein
MKARTSLPGSSGARRARSASSSRFTFPSCSTFPQVNERRNDPSVDGARTPPNSAGLAPCRSRSRSSMLSAPPAIPATRQPPSPPRSPRTGRRAARARRPGRPGPPAGPGPSPGPGRPATPDSGHRTLRGSSPGCATIALARCPFSSERGSVSNSHRPSSEGTFRVDAPQAHLFTRWIEAKNRRYA